MYKRIGRWICFFIAISTLLIACAKGNAAADDGGVHTPTPSDTTAPVITIITPVMSQSYNSGNAINITGNISDDFGLYQGYIRIVNDANGFEMARQSYVIHGVKSYNLNYSHTPVVSAVSDYTITVSFEDHGSNVTTRSVKVKINP